MDAGKMVNGNGWTEGRKEGRKEIPVVKVIIGYRTKDIRIHVWCMIRPISL